MAGMGGAALGMVKNDKVNKGGVNIGVTTGAIKSVRMNCFDNAGPRRSVDGMGRAPRITEPGVAYHLLNRRVMRLAIFEKAGDYAAFEEVLAESPRGLFGTVS